MESYQRKLPKEAGAGLFQVKVSTVKPYIPMLGPAYVFLERNDKFISVKRPLDFFSEKELLINAPFEYFYFPKAIQNILPFQEAGRSIRKLLLQVYQAEKRLSDQLNLLSGESEADSSPFKFPVTAFQLSDLLMLQLHPIFKIENGDTSLGLDLISIVALVNEVCDFEGHKKWVAAREKNVDLFEKTVFYSSWAVFMALLIDYHELNFLNDLKLRVFDGVMNKQIIADKSLLTRSDEIDELIILAVLSVEESGGKAIRLEDLRNRKEKIARKIADRIEKRTGTSNVRGAR